MESNIEKVPDPSAPEALPFIAKIFVAKFFAKDKVGQRTNPLTHLTTQNDHRPSVLPFDLKFHKVSHCEQTRLNEEKVAKLLINRTDGETNETFIVSKFS